MSEDTLARFKWLFEELETVKRNHNICLLKHLEDKRVLDLPIIHIYSEGEIKLEICELDFVLRIEDSNLNLFEDISHDFQNEIKVSTQDEFVSELNEILSICKVFESSYFKSLHDKSEDIISHRKKIIKNKLSEEILTEICELERTVFFDFGEKFYKKLIETEKLKNYMSFKNANLEEDNKPEGRKLYYYLQDVKRLICLESKDNNEELLAVIWMIFENYQQRKQGTKNLQSELNNLNDKVSLVTLPLALFDQHNNILVSNEKFKTLNMTYSKCEEFSHSSQIEIQSDVYKVLKRSLSHNSLFVFIPLTEFLEGTNNPTNHELGIISSSIAHEINNPLAGILAAIDFLILDIEDQFITGELEDMKKGVKRCKTLVDLFLGFSNLKHDKKIEPVFPDELFLQAIEMTRFRLVEKNVHLDLVRLGEKKKLNLNKHIFTMLNYLLIGEVLTSISHNKLIVGNHTKNNHIKIGFEFSGNQMVFKFPFSLSFLGNFIDSRLTKHLLEALNLQVKIKDSYLLYE